MTETNTTAAAEAAFEAYREVNDLHPADSLSYAEACKHDNGDTLADFLVIELIEGVEDEESPAPQHDRGIALLEKAVRDLSHVKTELEDRREQLQGGHNDT